MLEDQFFEDPAFEVGPFLEARKQLIKQGFYSKTWWVASKVFRKCVSDSLLQLESDQVVKIISIMHLSPIHVYLFLTANSQVVSNFPQLLLLVAILFHCLNF